MGSELYRQREQRVQRLRGVSCLNSLGGTSLLLVSQRDQGTLRTAVWRRQPFQRSKPGFWLTVGLNEPLVCF